MAADESGQLWESESATPTTASTSAARPACSAACVTPTLTPRAVNIAGTKGRGSTAAFLSDIIVGCYSSPRLLTSHERISVGLLRQLIDEAKRTIAESIETEKGALTHFELASEHLAA
ncbi:hypothetical protein ACP70R_045571 [Stipagrostis hirtigluma subsp. patula]